MTPSTHWIGDWVGPRAGLDVVAKGKNPCLVAYKLLLVFEVELIL